MRPLGRSANTPITNTPRRVRAAAVVGALGVVGRLLASPAAVGAQGVPAEAEAPLTMPDLRCVRYTLPNGLEVVLHEDHRTPTVAVNLWYHVGSKDEPADREGFAHLFEHLMFQGSRHVAEDTYYRQLEGAGSSAANGTTNEDRTNYFETLPAGRLNLALWLESDRMAYLLEHVDQATFESQRAIVLNERRQTYENAPYGHVRGFFTEATYPPTHPYHHLPIGSPDDLNAATLPDVWRFFQTWYVPNNATLVVAGDIQPEATRALIERYFGPIPRGADVPRAPAPPPVVLAGERRLVVEAGVELPRVYVVWPTPAFFAPGDAALDLVAATLSHGRSSRLIRHLIRERELAHNASAAQVSRQLGSLFIVEATAQPGRTAEEVLAGLDEILAELRATAPEADEVFRGRIQEESDHIFGVERVTARAERFNLYNQQAGDPEYLRRDVGRYRDLTPADVQAAARTLLPPDRRVVVLVHPTPGAPPAGRLVSPPGGAP